MPLFGNIRITDHIMRRMVQPVDLFVGSSDTVIFYADRAGIVIRIHRRINDTSVFIVVYAVLNKVCDCAFQQILIRIYVAGRQAVSGFPFHRKFIVDIHIHKIHKNLSHYRYCVFLLHCQRLHMIFQPGGKIEVVNQRFDSLTLLYDDRGFFTLCF